MAIKDISVSNGTAKQPKPKLWTHPNPDSTQMAKFMHGVNIKYGLSLKTYEDLYKWSIDHIAEFWGEVWDFTGITAEKPYDEVRKNPMYHVTTYPYRLGHPNVEAMD